MSQEEINKIITISKEELGALPVAVFDGTIRVIDTEPQASEAVEILRREKMIGFDTETKPSFKRGQSNNVALLQLSTHKECFLFRLNRIGLPEPLKDLIEDPGIVKVGLSVHDDFHNLNKIYQLSPDGFIDLQNYVKEFMIADNSLARIYAILFDKRISKGQRLTNWEAETLTPHQQSYAALDALACITIYDYLSAGKFNPCESKYLQDVTKKED